MNRLSDTQSVILSAAATRGNRALLPVPGSVQAKGKTLERSLRALRQRGLAEERPTRRVDEVWRKHEDGRALGLVATAKGLAAIGIAELEGRQSSERPSATRPGPERKSSWPPMPECCRPSIESATTWP